MLTVASKTPFMLLKQVFKLSSISSHVGCKRHWTIVSNLMVQTRPDHAGIRRRLSRTLVNKIKQI